MDENGKGQIRRLREGQRDDEDSWREEAEGDAVGWPDGGRGLSPWQRAVLPLGLLDAVSLFLLLLLGLRVHRD